jgi:8-oxo-dGTP pyrophosphatase MutT (NUDIX family)
LIARCGRDGRLRWSLPNGHVETIEEAAVREVEAETDIRSRNVASVGHRFSADRRWTRPTVPDAEVAWAPPGEVPARIAHVDERRLLTAVPRLVAGVT